MFYHQLGVAAHLQLIYFHEVGEVESSYDSLIFDLIIGGLEPDLRAYSVSIPSGEVRISPTLLPWALVAPSMENLQMGR